MPQTRIKSRVFVTFLICFRFFLPDFIKNIHELWTLFFRKGSFPHSFAQKLFLFSQNFVIIYFSDARILCWIHRVSRYSPTPRASSGFCSLHAKKNVPWHILAPRRGCFGNHLPLRRVRIPAERFHFIGYIFLWNENAGRHGRNFFCADRLFMFVTAHSERAFYCIANGACEL